MRGQKIHGGTEGEGKKREKSRIKEDEKVGEKSENEKSNLRPVT